MFAWMVLLSPWVALAGLIIWDTKTKRTTVVVIAEKASFEQALVNWTRVLGVSTVALVCATLLTAVVLHRTDEAIHRQLEVMERDEEPQIDFNIHPKPEFFEGRLAWSGDIRNSGKRSANNFSIRKYLKIGAGRFFELRSSEPGTDDMPPGANSLITAFSLPITELEANRVVEEGIVRAFFEFTYTDRQGRGHKSSYCLEYNGKSAPGLMSSDTCRSEIAR